MTSSMGVALAAAMWALPLESAGATELENTAPIQRPSQPAPDTPAPQPEATQQPEAGSARSRESTSQPAPAAPPPTVASPEHASGGALRATHEPQVPEDELPHAGFTLGARLGATGCLRSMCTDAHGATPGLRVDGFIGGNIRGFVDLGIAGGWGSYGASVEQDANLLRLYGIEPAGLQAAAQAMGSPLEFNPFALQVRSARLRTARVGPSLRVHVIPRGRGIAYLGAGIGYSTFLAEYGTAIGEVSMRFHGVDVPLQLGGGVQITKNIAAILQFDYTFNRYPIARFDHPQSTMTLPVAFLDSAARESSGSSVSDSLPQTWNVSLGLRARF